MRLCRCKAADLWEDCLEWYRFYAEQNLRVNVQRYARIVVAIPFYVEMRYYKSMWCICRTITLAAFQRSSAKFVDNSIE